MDVVIDNFNDLARKLIYKPYRLSGNNILQNKNTPLPVNRLGVACFCVAGDKQA